VSITEKRNNYSGKSSSLLNLLNPAINDYGKLVFPSTFANFISYHDIILSFSYCIYTCLHSIIMSISYYAKNLLDTVNLTNITSYYFKEYL